MEGVFKLCQWRKQLLVNYLDSGRTVYINVFGTTGYISVKKKHNCAFVIKPKKK